MATPDFARALDHVADRFVEDAAPVLIELTLYRLDCDDPEAVQTLVDAVLGTMREELLEAVHLGIGAE